MRVICCCCYWHFRWWKLFQLVECACQWNGKNVSERRLLAANNDSGTFILSYFWVHFVFRNFLFLVFDQSKNSLISFIKPEVIAEVTGGKKANTNNNFTSTVFTLDKQHHALNIFNTPKRTQGISIQIWRNHGNGLAHKFKILIMY